MGDASLTKTFCIDLTSENMLVIPRKETRVGGGKGEKKEEGREKENGGRGRKEVHEIREKL